VIKNTASGVNPRSGEGVSPQKGTIPTVGNLRNGSNDGIANVNLRNGMSNVNWNCGCCDNAKVLLGTGKNQREYHGIVRAHNKRCYTCAECTKWPE